MKIHPPGKPPHRQPAAQESPWAELWHRSAPAAVRRSYQLGDHGQGWEAWVRHLQGRRWPRPSAAVLPAFPGCLLWAALADVEVARASRRIQQIGALVNPGRPNDRGRSTAARLWRRRCAHWTLQPASALEALAWCHSLPQLAGAVSESLWRQMLDQWLGVAADADQLDVDTQPWVHQLVAGELRLTLAYLFPEITTCRTLARPARRSLSDGLVRLCDGEGVLAGRFFHLTRPLLACWTRCLALANEMGRACWSRDAQIQYKWLLRNAIRLTRADGTQAFCCDGVGGRSARPGRGQGAACEDLFDAALQLGGTSADRRIARLTLPGRRGMRRASLSDSGLPNSAIHSEWAGMSVLRAGWVATDPRLAVLWHEAVIRVELESAGRVILSGPWHLHVNRNGSRLEPETPWEEVCWVSDDDVDYLELEATFTGGVRVQRHLVLARKDRFLLLAEAVMDRRPGRWECRQCLGLAPGIRFAPSADSWEGSLVGQRRWALTMPLGLREWRAAASAGALRQNDGALELRQWAVGRALFVPLFVDLDTRRMHSPLTWRQLTVAQNRRIVPADVAVGYRVMVGKEQWLIYRALDRGGNRTVLGHNLITQLLVARFNRDGQVDPLVEIE